MKHFLGIDGGGSKTQFALCDENGRIIREYTTSGVSYREIGIEKVCELLKDGTDYMLKGYSNVTGACFGMPCFGENPADDMKAEEQIRKTLAPVPLTIINDVAAAWAGTLAFESGIIILAGTGSMALGRDIHGVIKRTGGWSEFFSDEGSCYWLGKRTLQLFSKQSDGRLPKNRLYDIVRAHFSLENDIDIVGIVETKIMSTRRDVAALQILLYQAAQEGDESARQMYLSAAREIASMIKALRAKMDLRPDSPWSYAGGVFNVKNLILDPLRECLEDLDMCFVRPRLTPVDGAILFAVDAFDPEAMLNVVNGLKAFRNLEI